MAIYARVPQLEENGRMGTGLLNVNERLGLKQDTSLKDVFQDVRHNLLNMTYDRAELYEAKDKNKALEIKGQLDARNGKIGNGVHLAFLQQPAA